MKIPLKLAMAFFVLLPSLSGGSPADDVKVVVFVTVVKQESPLQIVGFKLPEKVGGDPVLVLQNATNKPITDFYVAAAIGNPDAGSRGEAGPAYYTGGTTRVFWPNERAIPPKGEREAHENALRAHYLAHWGSQLHSNCLHVAAVVSSVTFADGEVWRLEGPHQEIWKSSLLPDSTKPCDHSSTVEGALKDWEGASGNQETGSPSHLDGRVVQSYSITCPLRKIDGKLVAICPW